MKQWLNRAIANPWVRRYILIGYASKGTLYLFMGILAIQAAIVPHRQASGSYLTLVFLEDRPLGNVLVFLLAVTLTGYVFRRLVQAILTPTDDCSLKKLKSIFQRLGYIVSALSYAGIAYSAMNIVFKLGEYDDSIEDLVTQLFKQPIGSWLTLLLGIVVITIGIGYIYGAYTSSYISEFESKDIDHRLEKWAIAAGKIGIAARGIAFVLTGFFIIQAAILRNSDLAGGLQNALRILATKPLGWLWLQLIGLGLICYGLYMFVASIYRRYAII